MSFSDYAENKILDHVFKGTAYTRPTHLYVGLSTADPLDDGSGLAEPSGNNYSRVEFDDWTTAASGETENNSAVTFPTPSASWGLCTHFAVFDDDTGGNLIGSGELGSPVTPDDPDVPSFDTGALTITLD